ncbi:MAG TPA: site-2 protease family protein [Oceanobacillus sp.]|nr:site-2 protease family protein [Oceanobacillus sp.]
MLNETASSTEDRPAQRSSVRLMSGEESQQHSELRQIVMSVLSIERELSANEETSNENLLLLGPNSRLVASFEGMLTLPSEEAYAKLDEQLAGMNYLPLFREAHGKHIVHVVAGRIRPGERPVWPNVLLFIATVFSLLLLGTLIAAAELMEAEPALSAAIANDLIPNLWRGLPYAISLLLILGAHELGHYFAARYHKLAVTLPYFIPAPPPLSPFGTFGAFIQLREPMRNRKMLLDVGAAGPLAGLVFAIPIVFIGLATSQVGPINPDGLMEGNSLLYAFSKIVVFGRFLPGGGEDVTLNQIAQAGWTGLLVTALNLMPVGQLDGGHVLYTLIGDAARKLYYPLLIGMALLVFLFSEAWLLWLVLLFLFGRVYAAPLDMITPLDPRRRVIAVVALATFVLTFVPVPFSVVTADMLPGGREIVMLTVVLATLWTQRRR